MNAVVRGTVLVLAGRWADRVLGFVSTLVLARLLTPADFGLVAMAWMVVGILDVFVDIGVNVQMIQKRGAEPDLYHTGFTLRLLQSSVLAFGMVVAAPFAAEYLKEPRLEGLLIILAPCLPLGALTSMGVVIRQKEMSFGPEVILQLVKKVAAIMATVVAAILLESYWALVIGNYVSTVAGVVLSYLLHPYRPKLTLSHVRGMWRHSTALFIQSILGMAAVQIDRITMSRLHSASSLGAYQLAGEIAALPTTELLAPFNKIFLPAFAEAQNDPAQLSRMFVRAMSVSLCMALPASVGLMVLAPSIVQVLLGPKWSEAIPLMQALAWAGIAGGLMSTCKALNYAQARFYTVAGVSALQVASFVAILGGGVLVAGATSPTLIAASKAASVALCTIVGYGLAIQGLPSGTSRRLLVDTWRLALASAVMGGVVGALNANAPDSAIVALLGLVVVGVVVYGGVLYAAWMLCGRPDGPERFILDRLVLPLAHRAAGALGRAKVAASRQGDR